MIQLLGREALKVRALPGVHDYKEFLADGVTKSKLVGEKYRRFVVDGKKAFIADNKDPFCSAFDSGLIYSVDLDSNTEGQLSLANFTTIAQEINMARTQQLLDSYSYENTVVTTPLVLDEETINALR
jgi:hypothetical protein